MLIEVLQSKIRYAKVTGASMDYHGSITIDEDLLDEMGVWRFQSCDVNLWGEDQHGRSFRGRTYVLPGKRGSGCVEVNGALAYHIIKGDIIHINIFVYMSPESAAEHKPIIIESNE